MRNANIERLSGGGQAGYLAAKGFTLAEMLVTIAIVGILAAVILPTVQKAQPNKLESLRRKSYYILEQTVSQMFDDDTMYRERKDSNSFGFRNTERIKLNGRTYEGDKKFCELFASTMNKRPNQSVQCINNQKTYSAADNVDWYLPVTDFGLGYGEVKFDVNGISEPNCEYNAQTCPQPDTFRYYVLADGRITESKPGSSGNKYCIITSISGEGTVEPGDKYCGLTNGTYTLMSKPSSGWISNWADNKRDVTVNNSDVKTSVIFSQDKKACINLNVACPAGLPSSCGTYALTGGTFAQDGNDLRACNLSSGTYKVTVTPKENYTSNWAEQYVALNGVDQNLSVSLSSSQSKHCAILDVTCPGGGASNCGTYTIEGNGNTYGMNISANEARSCVLPNGTYKLNVETNKRYIASNDSFSFNILNKDWNGQLSFSYAPRCSAKGYFMVGNQKYSCPFTPTRITTAECNNLKASHGIQYCGYEFNTVADDYWAGAVKQCGGVHKLPSAQELAYIAQYLTINNPPVGAYENITYNSGWRLDKDLVFYLEIPGGSASFSFWSNEELIDGYHAGHFANVRRYGLSGTTVWERYSRNGVGPNAICKLN